MSLDLPTAVAQKLQQTLAQWRRWKCDKPPMQQPEPVGILGGGLSNFSVLVTGPERFVVRIDGENPSHHGLNRLCEWRSLNAAWEAKLAPQPCYFNPELGSLVCTYLEPDANNQGTVADIGRLLRGIHSLPGRRHRLDLAERIKRYRHRLAGNEQDLVLQTLACNDAIDSRLQEISRREEPLVLCHADLLRANRLYSGKQLWALDWEYCAMGSLWYDLAVVIHADELDADTANGLLESYLDRPVKEADLEALAPYSATYRYLELLWYLAHTRSTIDEELLVQKLAKLLAILDK